MTAKIRSFVAIEVPEEVQANIAQAQVQLKRSGERISWVKPSNIHLTLKFLGEVDSGFIEPLNGALKRVATRVSAFSFRVEGLGAFPNVKRPRVIWAGVIGADEQLLALVQELEPELEALGFSAEKRKFKPHLTIGRVKSPPRQSFRHLLSNITLQTKEVLVAEILLMKSELKPAGAIYTTLGSASMMSQSA